MTFRTAVLCEPGGRPVNEDACRFFVHGSRGCWAVADGLSARHGGEIASHVAVEAVIASFQCAPDCETDCMRRHIEHANNAILEKQREAPEFAAMRSTLVALVTDGLSVFWGHVGDSRLYRFGGGTLRGQTLDHSVPQALCAAGEIQPAQIRFHEDRASLLRSLGTGHEVRASISDPEPLDSSDTFLLCSDGFWEYVTEQEMEADLNSSSAPEEWLDRMRARLQARAQDGHDNYSAIAVWRSA